MQTGPNNVWSNALKEPKYIIVCDVQCQYILREPGVGILWHRKNRWLEVRLTVHIGLPPRWEMEAGKKIIRDLRR